MTAPENVRLCAEAMRLDIADDAAPVHYWQGKNPSSLTRYDPLHDDAQAMALVKKFGLNIAKIEGCDWAVWRSRIDGHNDAICGSPDLNTAIVECVAKKWDAQQVGTGKAAIDAAKRGER